MQFSCQNFKMLPSHNVINTSLMGEIHTVFKKKSTTTYNCQKVAQDMLQAYSLQE